MEEIDVRGFYFLYNNNNCDRISVILKYEKMSFELCIRCGKKASHVSRGYMLPFCEDCMQKEKSTRNFIELKKDDSKK